MDRSQIIITADDLGISEGVNRGIAECFEQGILTTCSLLANGLAFEHAVKDTLVSSPELPVGVHLNIMFGKPMRLSHPALVGSDGLFHGSYWSVLKHFQFQPSKTLRIAVLDEFKAQTEYIAEHLERPIDHFNTQSHVHSIPALFDLVHDVASQSDCLNIRLCKERPQWPFINAHVGLTDTLRAGLLYWLSSQVKTKSRGIPQRIMGMNRSGYVLEDAIKHFASASPKGLSEICIHPGYALPKGECLYGQPWVDGWIADAGREMEMNALKQWSRLAFEERYGVKLRPFNLE